MPSNTNWSAMVHKISTKIHGEMLDFDKNKLEYRPTDESGLEKRAKT